MTITWLLLGEIARKVSGWCSWRERHSEPPQSDVHLVTLIAMYFIKGGKKKKRGGERVLGWVFFAISSFLFQPRGNCSQQHIAIWSIGMNTHKYLLWPYSCLSFSPFKSLHLSVVLTWISPHHVQPAAPCPGAGELEPCGGREGTCCSRERRAAPAPEPSSPRPQSAASPALRLASPWLNIPSIPEEPPAPAARAAGRRGQPRAPSRREGAAAAARRSLGVESAQPVRPQGSPGAGSDPHPKMPTAACKVVRLNCVLV